MTAVTVARSAYRMQKVPLSYNPPWQEIHCIRSTRWRRRLLTSGLHGAGALLHPLRGIGAYRCCAPARLPACSLDMTLTYPCRFAQVRILPHQARSRRFMVPKERAKSEGITFTVSRIHVDAKEEPSARHRSTFSSSPTTKVGAIETLTARSKQRCAAHRRAPTPWQSRQPSQLLSTSACMSMACSRVAGEILRRVADGWRLPTAVRPSP